MKNKFLKRVLLILLLVSCVLGALYLFNNETNKIKNPDKKSISETIIETQQESNCTPARPDARHLRHGIRC